MAELRTEEEQIEALKNWWSENGKSLVLSAAAVLAGVFGWKGWQQHQLNQTEAASASYQQLLDASLAAVSGDKDQLATSQHLAGQLQKDFSGTEYARLGALLMAKVAVSAGDLDLAMQQLDWLLASEPSEFVASLATLRKAQLLSAKGEFDTALGILSAAKAVELGGQVAEMKGDVLLAKGDAKAAREAYLQAQSLQAGAANPLLTMKLDDLAVKEG